MSYYVSTRLYGPHEHRSLEHLFHVSFLNNSPFWVVMRRHCCLLYPIVCDIHLQPVLFNPGNVPFFHKSCSKGPSETSNMAVILHHLFWTLVSVLWIPLGSIFLFYGFCSHFFREHSKEMSKWKALWVFHVLVYLAKFCFSFILWLTFYFQNSKHFYLLWRPCTFGIVEGHTDSSSFATCDFIQKSHGSPWILNIWRCALLFGSPSFHSFTSTLGGNSSMTASGLLLSSGNIFYFL